MEIDIKYLGPGMWYEYHSAAAKCNSAHKISEFVTYLQERAQNFPCAVCRPHFVKYLEEHPIRGTSAQEVLYETFVLHNLVNERLGKSKAKWQDVREFYMSPKVCTDCGTGRPDRSMRSYDLAPISE